MNNPIFPKIVKKGKLIVIVAPSGTGKSTLIKKLKADYPSIVESISYTTRKMRPGEVEGKSYYFTSKEEFFQRKEKGEFLEWAEVHGNFYGTSKSFVLESIEKGKSVLFDLDVQGTDNLKLHFGSLANVVFIAPPSIEELEKRLKSRGTETTQIINLRIENAKQELLRKEDFDFLIYNDNLEDAYQRLQLIVDKILNEE